MSALREAANKMLKMLEEASLADPALAAEVIYKIGAALPSFRAALAQEQAGPKPMHPELRKMWEEHFDRCFRAMPLPAQEQAEPLNLSDRAVQRRLAAQWGYVPAAQAEPVEPVAWRTFDGEGGYDYRTYEDNEHYAAAWAQRNPNHVGWVEPLYIAPPQRKPLPKHDQHCVDVPGYGLMAVRLVRAVERAHGIKE